MKWERESKVTWTNWTFGFWSGKIGLTRRRGIDVGPLEIVWSEPKGDARNRRMSELRRRNTALGKLKLGSPLDAGGKRASASETLNRKESRRPQPGEYPKPSTPRGIVSPFPYDSGPVRKNPDLTGRRQDLENFKADQKRIQHDWPL